MDEKKKTTMSVPEMRRMLGLGKTDSYWLVHRQCFETIIVAGKMRVVIDSFEHWYANQIKYKKGMDPRPVRSSGHILTRFRKWQIFSVYPMIRFIP